MSDAGRSCPLAYRYTPAALAAATEQSADMLDTLYVIGGLYGNLPALAAIEAMAAREASPVTLCFNGDFNWFNVDDASFRAVNEFVLKHDAILGNVEAELFSASDDAGCGCAYPASVDAGIVARSNRIHARLKQTALRHADVQTALSRLPLFTRYRVGELNIGVVHGDAESLAGWRFDSESLDQAADEAWRQLAFTQAKVDVFASSHSCAPVMRNFQRGTKLIANNGAAGMPNIAGLHCGLLTRISSMPSPHTALYGHTIKGIHIDALPINYDQLAWQAQFLSNWPEGSDAWQSYFQRISSGAQTALEHARCKESALLPDSSVEAKHSC